MMKDVIISINSLFSFEEGEEQQMEFKEGLKSAFQYTTPFGNATMGINTRRIRQNMGLNGGKVEIDYVVDMEHMVASRNKFEITVTEIPPQ